VEGYVVGLVCGERVEGGAALGGANAARWVSSVSMCGIGYWVILVGSFLPELEMDGARNAGLGNVVVVEEPEGGAGDEEEEEACDCEEGGA